MREGGNSLYRGHSKSKENHLQQMPQKEGPASCMMVMIQDARKLELPRKFDAIWLGPYLVRETFPNNLLQLETLNGERVPTRTSGSRCKEYKT